MKSNKAFFICVLMILCGFVAAAQEAMEYNTNQRISDQLKNGTAPGYKFGPQSKAKKVDTKPVETTNTIGRQLKNGGLQGANIARGGGAAANRTATNARRSAVGSQQLPSDQKASAEMKTGNPAGTNLKEPTQGNVPQPDLKIVVPKAEKKAVPANGGSPRSVTPANGTKQARE